jgi:2-phosphosulfolactate phosphatase
MTSSRGRPWANQEGFDLRFDWGPGGVERLAPHVRSVVIVDVLRFTSAVETACAAGIAVLPYRWKDQSAEEFARSQEAVLAGRWPGPSLSPPSLLTLAPGTRVVLPSPNGATCSLLAAEAGVTVVAACLRNAGAVAKWLASAERPIAVIACGEAWPDGSIRPAYEDLIGAGAVLAQLEGSDSPEADAAASAFVMSVSRLEERIAECASARELYQHGRAEDVEWCAQLDASEAVPVLRDGAFLSG